MNKLSKILIFTAILFSVLFQYGPRLDIVISHKASWIVSNILLTIQIVFLYYVICSLIPYKMLITKTVAFALGTLELISTVLYSLYYYIGVQISVVWAYIITSIIVYTWVLFISYREYYKSNDTLDEDHFFMVGVIPHDFKGFITSLFNNPFGGVGVYADGVFYHYRKDYMRESSKESLLRINQASKKYRFIKKRKIDKETLDKLKDLKNGKHRKFGLFHNCKTVLEPLLKG